MLILVSNQRQRQRQRQRHTPYRGMEYFQETQRRHAVCIPFPAQGHINPMLKFAILLHHKGFHITFVNTEYNHNRLLRSRGPAAVECLPDFQFKTIPDGLSTVEEGGVSDATQDIVSLCLSTQRFCLTPLTQLIKKLNQHGPSVPPVSCIIADSIMSFALDAAEEIGVPGVILRTSGACSFLCFKNVCHLEEKGLIPLKDESCFTNGYMNASVDWIPGLIPLRLRDFPSFIFTTDPNDPMLNYTITEVARSSKASAIIINTIDELEHKVLVALSSICPPIYTIGPLQFLINQLPENSMKLMNSSLWKEEPECLKWLDLKQQNSVIYVNFGSITVLTSQQLSEFAWGLAESKKNFLWIVRPDLVHGENAALPPEFCDETKDRGFIAGWCPQEEVLRHPAVGGFLTHCGWNSIIESVYCGVPLLCWPFFADQQVNCRYACDEWGIGMEINRDIKKDEVGFLVRELLDGEKGQMIKKKAIEWKDKAAEAIAFGGSSQMNFSKLVKEVLTV